MSSVLGVIVGRVLLLQKKGASSEIDLSDNRMSIHE
jgi:hypothetical protein